ncbi:hypothetical protein L208DRAFT_1280111 [Tricholoma matsutake]|nr:hypothetical protein L208DRAFT_1280111 [Tricholoma matsutake 945]
MRQLHNHGVNLNIDMLQSLQATLKLDDPFEACVWPMASCVFWGMMRFSEVSVTACNAFDPAKHLTCGDALFSYDLDSKLYVRLNLPSAKTAKPRETQSIYMVSQDGLCPLEALQNLSRVVPADKSAPLFLWQDKTGTIHPMVKTTAINHINSILKAWDWGTTFGHSFRISGASFYLSQKVDPKIIRLAGHWRSLTYEAYIQAFKQVASRHFGGLLSRVNEVVSSL